MYPCIVLTGAGEWLRIGVSPSDQQAEVHLSHFVTSVCLRRIVPQLESLYSSSVPFCYF